MPYGVAVDGGVPLGIIIQICIGLAIIIASLGATDLMVSGVKGRRRRKALEERRAHQLLLAEKIADPVALLMTDRELARDVYAELKAKLDAKDEDAPEELPEAEEPKKKKAQKRLPAGKRRA
jgi:flagellar basal body-associated protein FliL